MRASEKAYAALREGIIEWRLAPGRVLSEVDQAQALGLSRTPVREAFARLLADGLVEAHAGRGVVVVPVSPEKVRQMYRLRILLETEAASLAARRAERGAFRELAARLDDAAARHWDRPGDSDEYYALVREMDRTIDAATGNDYLVQAQQSLRNHLERVRHLSRDNEDRLREAAREHALIARAIADGRPELAAAATRIHLTHSLDVVLAAVEPGLAGTAAAHDAEPPVLHPSSTTLPERIAS